MDTSMRLPAADTTALQSPRSPPRQNGLETPRVSGAPEAAPGVQVSISAQGRAAEQAARLETSASSAIPPETAQAAPVTAPAEVAATAQIVSSVATPGPAADPARAQQAQNASAEARGVSTAQTQSDQRPDSATAATSQSVQLYLENASIPSGQSSASAVRTSA